MDSMTSITSITKEFYEWKVKFSKKMIVFYATFFTFCLAVTCYDFIILFHTRDYLSGITFGSMCTAALWAFLYLLSALSDLKTDKSHLKNSTELYENQLACGERQMYLYQKQLYEQELAKIEKDGKTNDE